MESKSFHIKLLFQGFVQTLQLAGPLPALGERNMKKQTIYNVASIWWWPVITMTCIHEHILEWMITIGKYSSLYCCRFMLEWTNNQKKWRSCISLLSSQSNGWLFRKCTNYVWTKISRNLGILETINTAWQLLPNPNRNSFWQHLLFINLSNHVVLINWFNQINWTRLCISKMSFLLLPSRRLRAIWPCKNRRLNSIHRFPAREIHNNITNIQETFICLSRF